MNESFRIEKRESFRVLGYTIKTTNQRSEGRKVIPKHWENFKQNQLEKVLLSLNQQEPFGILGISVYNTEEDNRKFDYCFAVSSHQEPNPELSSYVVPACTWAVFPCSIETIGRTEVKAIMKWLPQSKYRPLNKGYMTGRMKTEAPDIQYYGKDGYVEVWIAVTEK